MVFLLIDLYFPLVDITERLTVEWFIGGQHRRNDISSGHAFGHRPGLVVQGLAILRTANVIYEMVQERSFHSLGLCYGPHGYPGAAE